MSTRIYTINRALVLPLALNAVLLLTVLALTAVRPSTAAERVLLAAALVPMAVIAVEASLRRVAVGDAGLVLSKFFKQRSLQWADITHVGALAVRRKVYLVLTTTKGFHVLSNAYGRFGDLVRDVLAHVEAQRVEEGAREILEAAGENRANRFAAWLAAVLLLVVAAMKIAA
ncbi:MAG: hypothetical protein KBH73_00155 [Syntrophobacterales bacterium]|nr:hypothetical protein [Syntrophobacterales bacterium]HNQ01971.1 hypothetical protein [Syntrophales bacterium]